MLLDVPGIQAKGLRMELPFREVFPIANKIRVNVVQNGSQMGIVDRGHGCVGVLIQSGPYVSSPGGASAFFGFE